MKRIIAVFLTLTLTVLFVGCGKNNEVPPTTTTPYIDSGVNNNYNNEYIDNSNLDTTYLNSDASMDI